MNLDVHCPQRSRMSLQTVRGKSQRLARPIAAALAGVLVVLMVGCGGGGGGSTAVAPAPAPTLSISVSPVVAPSLNGQTNVATSATVALSAEFTPVNFTNPTAATFSTSTGAGVTLSCGGVAQTGKALLPAFTITQVAGAVPVKFVATSSVSMTGLPNSANCVFSVPLTISGGGAVSTPVTLGFSFTTVTAADVVLNYQEKTYAIFTGAYFYAVTKTGITPVVNKTKYTFGAIPLSNCGVMDPSFTAQTKGKVLAECQAADGTGRHVLYIDPTKNEIYEYTGVVPSNLVFIRVNPLGLVKNKPEWDSQTKVADGWYYTLATGNWVLWFLNDATGVSTIVKAGTFLVDGNINHLATYSNY